MASNRWVAIDPDILTHPLVGAGQPVPPADPVRGGAYSRMEAWLWIICNASFADHTIMNRGRKMTLQRGDLLGAWAFLAHTFNWSAKTTRAWVEKLIEDNMLQRRAIENQVANGVGADATNEPVRPAETFYGNQATILSIVNYWKFQFDGDREGQPRGNQKGNQLGGQLGNQSADLSVSELADKYVVQQQHGQPIGQAEGQPKGQHITKTTNYPSSSNNEPLSEVPSDQDPKSKKAKKPRRSIAYTEEFEVFWGGYPDQTNNSKSKAFEEWERLGEPDRNAAVASLPSFGSYCRKNPDYRVVHAERYLKDRRWEGHLPKASHRVWWEDPAQVSQVTPERWRDGIGRYANGIWSVKELGPPPGSPKCVVPPSIVAELRLTELYDTGGIRRR